MDTTTKENFVNLTENLKKLTGSSQWQLLKAWKVTNPPDTTNKVKRNKPIMLDLPT